MHITNLRLILLAAGTVLVVVLLFVGLMRGRQTARASSMRDLRRLEEPAIGELPDIDAEPPAATLAGAAAAAASVDGPEVRLAVAAAEPPRPSIAGWPPADERIICSLRLLPARQERLSGRRLRQGLQSVGFMHGDLAIYHLPGREGHAMLSAANLSQPGQLDPTMMDYQRFAGLQLFTVLPGKVPAATALSQLYAVTSELARRVEGLVHDGSGRPLEPAGVDSWLQQQLRQSAAPARSGVAAG